MRHRHTTSVAMAGALAVLSLTITLAPTFAEAATCSPSNSSHCYGRAIWTDTDGPVYGIRETLNVSCLGPENAPTGSNFVTEEEWLGTDNTAGSDWVEVGMAYGFPKGSTRYFYWADKRPSHAYSEHDLTISASLHTNYVDEITWAGSSSWRVYRGSTELGKSTLNPGSSLWESTGEETTSAKAAAAATMTNLASQASSGGAFIPDWTFADISDDQPPYAAWTATDLNLEAYSNCSFSAVRPQPRPAAARPLPAAHLGRSLRKIALALAAGSGVRAPRAISYLATTRQRAVRAISSDTVNSDQKVYLVRMHGSFIGYGAKVPPGQTLPRGSVMTALIDPATGQVTDWSISPAAPDTARLGRMTPVR